LALCLRIICTGENAAEKSRFPVTDGLSGARRGGIHNLYDGPLGRPEESGRDGKGGTVSIISALLFIDSGSPPDAYLLAGGPRDVPRCGALNSLQKVAALQEGIQQKPL